MQLAAYYYPATRIQKAAGRLGKYELHRLDGRGGREVVASLSCGDIRSARLQAAQDAAKPWNF